MVKIACPRCNSKKLYKMIVVEKDVAPSRNFRYITLNMSGGTIIATILIGLR